MSRTRTDSVLPGSHLRQCHPERHGRGSGTCSPSDDGRGTGCSRWQQVGAGLSADIAGASITPMGLQECCHPVQATGLCPSLSSTVGHCSGGLCQRGGLHLESKGGDDEETATARPLLAFPGSCCEAEAET